MKNKKTLWAVIAAVGMGTLGTANAQIALPENKGVNIGLPSQVGEGNSIEKDVAPLMRSIAKKKSEVDLKALDRELEKMQDDSLKDQIAREKLLLELQQLSSGQALGNNVAKGVGFQSPNTPPSGLPYGQAPQASGTAAEAEPEDSVRVLLVYGFADNLKAKIAMNGVGGYIVQKGDVLPDGRKVLRVANSFVEVQGTNSKERLPIAGNKAIDRSGKPVADNTNRKQIIVPVTPPGMK